MSTTVLYVPGLGSKNGSSSDDTVNCKVITFDYKHSSKAIIDFFADNYTFITTDRVKRLEDQIENLYKTNLFIIAHSHGALLVHNALKDLGKKYGREYSLNITVATFGPAKAIPLCHKRYILKDATNVFFENDWIINRFKNKKFSKLKRDVPVIFNVNVNGTNCNFKILIKSRDSDLWCTSGTSWHSQNEAHRCYFNKLIPDKQKEFCS